MDFRYISSLGYEISPWYIDTELSSTKNCVTNTSIYYTYIRYHHKNSQSVI